MSTIKPLAIFEPIPPEIQEMIISYCDTDSLVTLSGVNTNGSENLTNEVFFKAYFIKQHPRLKPYDRLFTVLCSTHPNNCWKVVCQIMHLPKNQARIATRLSPSFTQEAVEKIRLQIVECEQIDKSVCGLRYQDPNSPIHQAWNEFKKYEEEYNAAVTEQFLSSPWVETDGLVAAEIARIRNPLFRKRTLKHQSLQNYNALEKQRRDNLTKKQQLSNCLANPGQAHIEALSAERRTAVNLETGLADTDSLEACHALIADLIKNPEKRTPEAHQKILGFINSCEYDLKKMIWGMLYFQCANQVIEESWAEKHCMDHLPMLKTIIDDHLHLLRRYTHAEGSQYKSPIFALINSDDELVTTVANHFFALNKMPSGS